MKKILILFVLILLLFLPALLRADEISDLKSEVEDLKSRLEVVESEGEDFADRIARFVTISGYADGEYIATDKDGDNNRFRVHHLSLFFKKQVAEQWRLFSEVEYEDAPQIEDGTADGELFVEVFYIEYLPSRYANLRLGRFLTPGGIWNVEHYPPFVATQNKPQHIKKIFPQVTDGLQLHGSANVSDVLADYILYVGNGSGNSGHGDGNENKGVGGRLKLTLPVSFLTTTEVGFSAYGEKDNDDLKRRAYGADLRLQWKGLRFQGEYAKGNFDPSTGADYHRTGYYGQFIYDYKKLSFIYRYDRYEPDSTVNDDETTINTVALNYHFTPSVVAKVEDNFVNPEDTAAEDYYEAIFSIAIYLGE